jgi:hypothetical protein
MDGEVEIRLPGWRNHPGRQVKKENENSCGK